MGEREGGVREWEKGGEGGRRGRGRGRGKGRRGRGLERKRGRGRGRRDWGGRGGRGRERRWGGEGGERDTTTHPTTKTHSNTEQTLPLTLFFILSDSCQLTLDPNTANQFLCLSEGNRKFAWSDEVQSYPDHPDRFTFYNQVLCREGLSGVCYWEVEWSGGGVGVAVSYKGISRKGRGSGCSFGHNDQSWLLFCSLLGTKIWHNNINTVIRVPCFSRVGVHLDHMAGTLSFYSVSDTMTLLHRVQTTFTQPLYPGKSLLCFQKNSTCTCN
uniref:B30.2/SPRY domain-containing protein n=1 Tax=Esox lucius TaxID=8010 RepID=A0AAY5K2I0_ESOLU